MPTDPSSLRIQLGSFVGRQRERAEVERLLGTTRLLTLVGAGDAGKTRLALEVGRGLASEYRDGVVLVRCRPMNVVSWIGRPLIVTPLREGDGS